MGVWDTLSVLMQRYSVYLLATLLLLTSGCNRATTATKGRTAEAYVPVPGSVGFDIEPFERGDGSFRLTATYTSQGRTAKFRLSSAPRKPWEAETPKISL
jgi:hypothetical protein